MQQLYQHHNNRIAMRAAVVINLWEDSSKQPPHPHRVVVAALELSMKMCNGTPVQVVFYFF